MYIYWVLVSRYYQDIRLSTEILTHLLIEKLHHTRLDKRYGTGTDKDSTPDMGRGFREDAV